VLVGASVSGMEETGNGLGFECSVDGGKRNKSDLLAIECEVYDEFGVIFDMGN